MIKPLVLKQNIVEIKEIEHWWGKSQVAEKCRSAILTTFEVNLRMNLSNKVLVPP
jgi:hypothetical protein